MILPRLITMLVGLPLLIVCIHGGGIPFFVLITGIIILGQREFYRMAMMGGYDAQPWIGQIFGILMLGSLLWNGTWLGYGSRNAPVSLLVMIMLIVMFVRELFSHSMRQSVLRISITYLGIFYVVWTLGHLCLLRELRPLGREYTYFLFIVVWVVDIMAYIIGKRYGRFKLAHTISPGKTVEGTVGGIISGMIAGLILQPLILYQWSPLHCMILSLGIGLLAQVSDLAESILKRSFGVKDASALLPGHGGILDRFDSFIFAAPLFYYYLLTLK